MLRRDSCLACTEGGQLWATLTAALLVLVQDQLLDPVHRLLAGQHRPHHHLDLLVTDLGGATLQGAAGVGAAALASGEKKYIFLIFKLFEMCSCVRKILPVLFVMFRKYANTITPLVKLESRKQI